MLHFIKKNFFNLQSSTSTYKLDTYIEIFLLNDLGLPIKYFNSLDKEILC